MSDIDWSKAPAVAEGAMVAQFGNEVITKGMVRFVPYDGWKREDHSEGSKAWLYVPRPRCVETPTTWDCQGLPPVGAEVHIYDPDGSLVYGQGESGEVVAHVENTAVVRMSYGLGCFTAKHLRTSEQIKAEERSLAIGLMCDLCPQPSWVTTYETCASLYDSGYRKQEAL